MKWKFLIFILLALGITINCQATPLTIELNYNNSVKEIEQAMRDKYSVIEVNLIQTLSIRPLTANEIQKVRKDGTSVISVDIESTQPVSIVNMNPTELKDDSLLPLLINLEDMGNEIKRQVLLFTTEIPETSSKGVLNAVGRVAVEFGIWLVLEEVYQRVSDWVKNMRQRALVSQYNAHLCVERENHDSVAKVVFSHKKSETQKHICYYGK